MPTETLGIIIHGATSGIANRQHFPNALMPIIKEGGLKIGDRTVLPKLLLVGRDEGRLRETAGRYRPRHDGRRISMRRSPTRPIRSSSTPASPASGLRVLRQAIAAGKHVYTEKPVVTDVAEGRELIALAEAAGVKFGVVEDKLFMPGPTKLRLVRESGFFGRITGFRLDFGYWIFSHPAEGPGQRPSWNYRKAEGGSLVLDMYPHWRYVVEGVLGPIKRVVTAAWTAVPERLDEEGKPYKVDTDDANATLVELESGVTGTITSSWATRVRRDDVITFQVDGTEGSAVAGVHRCHVQSLGRDADAPPRPECRSRPRLFRRLATGALRPALHQWLPDGLGSLHPPRRCWRAARRRHRRRPARRSARQGGTGEH